MSVPVTAVWAGLVNAPPLTCPEYYLPSVPVIWAELESVLILHTILPSVPTAVVWVGLVDVLPLHICREYYL
jgi:hypothetical protein